mgnify:CR=1 FL=1
MDKGIDEAIRVLVGRITAVVEADKALKYTQAALNLAHVKGLVKGLRLKGAGGS